MIARASTRAALAGVGVLVAVLALPAPAWAHTQIDVDNPQAAAANVTMTVTAEAESSRAGIVSVRVQLPTALPAEWLSLVSGPPGWTLTPAADGYTMAGPALPVRQDARYVLHLGQLPPTAGVLTFKTVVTYADGQVDRWIEDATAANPSPEHPAPTVSLRPPAPAASSAAPSTGPAVSPTPVAAGTPAAPARPAGSPVGWWFAGVLLVAAAVAGYVLLRRRRGGDRPAGAAG